MGGTGRVAWHYGRPDMGVHVVLAASAPGELSRSTKDVWGLGAHLLDVDFKVGRFDMAIDNWEGLPDLDVICKAMEERLYTSR